MKLDVIGMGALNVDKLYIVNHIAQAEGESYILNSLEACGGSAANTTVGLAKLGLKVGYIGKVARDREGRLLLRDFEKAKVDVKGVAIAKKGRSGVVMGFVDGKGERALYVNTGVNGAIDFSEISLEYANNANFMHITSFVSDEAFQVQKRLVTSLSKNVKLSLDPGELYAKKGLDALKAIIKRCFAIFPNEHEVKLLTDKGYKKGAQKLLDEGAEIVAVKLGPKGCYVTDGKKEHLIPRFPAKVVDTTGAGDAFCAGFLYGLAKNEDMIQCGRLGNFVASRCIQEVGARAGLPYPSDLPHNLSG